MIFLREEPTVAFADNNRYSLAKIVDHGTFQNIQTKNEEVLLQICTYTYNKFRTTSTVINNMSVQKFYYVLHYKNWKFLL